MPALATRADSLRDYLTGAASDGGAQVDPDLSFGNFRSSSEAPTYGLLVSNPLTGITVDFASGDNNEGPGTVTRVDANNVRWNDNGHSPGEVLNLPSNGSTGIAESLENPSAYVRITRISASPITGSLETVALSLLFNKQFGMTDLAIAEALAGKNSYRASILKNDSAGIVQSVVRHIKVLGTSQISDVADLNSTGAGTIETSGSFVDWPRSGWCNIKNSSGVLKEIVYYSSRTDTILSVPSTGRAMLGTTAVAGSNTDILNAVPGVAIGLEPGGVDPAGTPIQTIAGEAIAPVGVTWNKGIDSLEGLSIGLMNPGEQIGIWVWRHIPALAVSTPEAVNQFTTRFNSA